MLAGKAHMPYFPGVCADPTFGTKIELILAQSNVGNDCRSVAWGDCAIIRWITFDGGD
jgi:hypothetical protein